MPVPITTALDGRRALVTGASRGIGAAIARALDTAGARVALTARDGAKLEAVAATLTNDPVVVSADLADPVAPTTLAAEALAALGGLDILVNNAALAERLPTVDTDAELVDRLYAVNVRAPLLLTAALIPALASQRRGSVVNVSSVSGVVGTPKRAAYAATKGALDAMTRSLAIELGPAGIRVNSVAPGVVDTDMWTEHKAIPGMVEHIEKQTPLRRWTQPEDIADVVAFLAGGGARMITGDTLCADGGLARTLDLYGGAD